MKRPPLMPAAVTASDRTCIAIFGVPWRTLKAFLELRGIPYGHVGRRPVVRVDLVLAALEGAEHPVWNEQETIERAARGGRR